MVVPAQSTRDGMVASHFITRLLGTFGRTQGIDKPSYFKTLSETLGGYSPEILHEAADKFIRTASSPIWPMPMRCAEVCDEVARARKADAQQSKGRRDVESYGLPEDAAVRILMAEDMNLGLKACDGAWQGDLVDFIKRSHRIPDALECEGLIVGAIARNQRLQKQEQDALEKLFGRDVSGRVLPDNHPVKIMLNAFAARRERFATMIAETVLSADTNEHA